MAGDERMGTRCDHRRRRRRTWRGLVVMASCLCLATAAGEPANIDVGYVQDGKTTYCQGIQQDQGPLVFETLSTSSANKCSIDVQISAEATSIGPKTPLAVKWSAVVHRGPPEATLFPNAIDPETKKPLDVIASLLRACKAGTNCGVPEGVVEPAVFTDDPSNDTGSFDANGTKTLKSYEFQFPQAGEDYVIVGKVVLPGDPKLNVSAQEFVAFQRVKVGADLNNATDAPKVHAGHAGEAVSDADVSMVARRSTSSPSAPVPESRSSDQSPSSPTGEERTSTGSSSVMSSKTVSIVGISGVVVVLVVVGYVGMGIHEKRKINALAQQRPTRSFSASFQNLDPNPEPMVPLRRKPSNNSTASRTNSSRDTTSTLHAGGDSGRPSRVSRMSRMSRVGGPKIPGGDMNSPATRSVGYGIMGDNRRGTEASRATSSMSRQTAIRTSQYGQTSNPRWSTATPKEIVRASHLSRQSHLSSHSASSWSNKPPVAKPYRPSSNGSLQPVRMTRGFSTSSTRSEDSECSVFSLSGGLTHVGPASYENAAIMESADDTRNRGSSVALLERDSDTSSLGSLHDSGEDLRHRTSSIGIEIIPRFQPSATSTSNATARFQSSVVSLTSSDFGASAIRSGHHAPVRESSFYRASSHVYRESTASALARSGLRESRSTLSSSGAFYARDTSEYNAPFTERDSASDSLDYQL